MLDRALGRFPDEDEAARGQEVDVVGEDEEDEWETTLVEEAAVEAELAEVLADWVAGVSSDRSPPS